MGESRIRDSIQRRKYEAAMYQEVTGPTED